MISKGNQQSEGKRKSKNKKGKWDRMNNVGEGKTKKRKVKF